MAEKEKKQMKFVEQILTPMNPKDAYYINYEQVTMSYIMVILVGIALIFYMIVY